MKPKLLTISILIMLLSISPTFAAADFPRMASLKRDEVNVRSGPGTRYPILWVFHRRGWPVELLAQYQNWYKIKDIEGEVGWVYRGLVSSQKTAIVTDGAPVVLYRKADGKKPLLQFAPDVVVNVEECGEAMCKVSHKKHKGWINKQRLNQGK